MLNIFNSIVLFVIIAFLCILYKKHEEKMMNTNIDNDNYSMLRKYLLADGDGLLNVKKPIMWIHVPKEYNSRNWLSFNSRSSYELNQNYLYLTLKSIIKNNDNDFHIIICDDSIFEKLLPTWNVNFTTVSDPIKSHLRTLGFFKILNTYGGLLCPLQFLCFKSFFSIYESAVSVGKIISFEEPNITGYSTSNIEPSFYPNTSFIGCNKDNDSMKELIQFTEITISSDFTSQMDFNGSLNKFLQENVNKHKIELIDGRMIGVKDINGTPIILDELMEEKHIKFDESSLGILIPSKEILSRHKYNYFARLSEEQILNSNCALCKYILLASTPNYIEGFIGEINSTKPNYWNGYWKTPLGPPLYGPRPLGVAPNDRVKKLPYPSN